MTAGHVAVTVTDAVRYFVHAADAGNICAAGALHAASVNSVIEAGLGKHRVTPSAACTKLHASFLCVSNHPWNCFAPSGVVSTCILIRVPLR